MKKKNMIKKLREEKALMDRFVRHCLMLGVGTFTIAGVIMNMDYPTLQKIGYVSMCYISTPILSYIMSMR